MSLCLRLPLSPRVPVLPNALSPTGRDTAERATGAATGAANDALPKLALKLNAYLTSLVRTNIGKYNLKNSITLTINF